MRKFIYLLSFVLFTGVSFISCEKDDDSEPKEKKLLPIKITEYEDGIYDGETIFEYDNSNKLIKMDYGDEYYNTFEYDSDNRLTRSNTFEDDSLYKYELYSYNSSNQIIKIQSYDKDDVAKSYYVHEYDINGNVIKKTQYNLNGTLVLYYTFLYDESNNMINEKYYWADYPSGVVSTEKYEEWTITYDDKNNIFKSVNMPFLWETYINNELTSTYIEHYGDNYTETNNNVYVYNEANYPVEYTEVDDGEKYEIEYKEI